MGFSKKHQVEFTKESKGKKWDFAGIKLRAPLKPISTNVKDDDDGDESTTPTARESRIKEKLACPAAPMKRRPALTCQVVREFFSPPDLESVFVSHAGRDE